MMRALTAALAWIALATGAARASDESAKASEDRGSKGETAKQQTRKPIPPLPELIRKLEADLSGATLIGVFTVDGVNSDRPPKEDQYTLGKVSKLPEADLWKFEAKVGFGGSDKTIPIVVAIRWAGDTPMVQLTDTTIPGLGTFSARVFFYEDRYAGTWKHGPFGGVMYGRIKKAGAPKTPNGEPKDK